MNSCPGLSATATRKMLMHESPERVKRVRAAGEDTLGARGWDEPRNYGALRDCNLRRVLAELGGGASAGTKARARRADTSRGGARAVPRGCAGRSRSGARAGDCA